MRFAAVSIIPSERPVRPGLLVQRAALPRYRVQGYAKRHRTGSAQDCGQPPGYGFRNLDLTGSDFGPELRTPDEDPKPPCRLTAPTGIRSRIRGRRGKSH